MATKKNRIKPEYEKIVNSDQPQDLAKLILKEVLVFSEEMLNHPEGQSIEAQTCLLRMINGVLIIAYLKGMNV